MNTQSRFVNSAYNILVGLLNKVIMLVLTFIGRNIFIRFIGIEYLGINGLFANILSILSLADLGFGTAMNYSFYRPLAEKDYSKIAALVNFYKKVYNTIAVGVAVLGLLLLPVLPYIVNTEREIENLNIYYICFLANSVVSYLMVYKSALINADQKNYVINRISIAVTVTKSIVQIIIAYILHNYLLYICMDIFATVANNLIISYIVTKHYPIIRNNHEYLTVAERKNIFSNLKAVFLYKISGTLLNSIDSLLISVLLGTVVVGYYSNYQTIITNINAIIVIVFGSVTASVGNLIQTGNQQQRYSVFKRLQMISFWLSGYITVGVLVLSGDFVELWIGSDFRLDYLVTIAIAFNLFFSTSMQPLWSFREATGLYQRTKYIMLLAAGLNLVLSILLGKTLGLAGIIIATVLARIFTYFWYEPHLLFREYFGISEMKYYCGYISNVFLIVLSVSVSSFICRMVNFYGWIDFLIKGVMVTIVTNLIYLAVYIRSEEFKWVKNRVISFLSRT